MPSGEPTRLADHIRRIAAPKAEALTDAELVGRYAGHRDGAAFEVLVWRHGPMVWAACRRVLRREHDVEDAFQATFLTLARSAGSIGTRQAVGGWLHRVAVNAALKLTTDRRTTGIVAEVPARPDPDGELAGILDAELDRLPARCRAAFVLCCLEGRSSAEAARELGCPTGTVDSRLHMARARLRARLTRLGFGPGALAGLVVAAPPTATLAAAVGVGCGVRPRPAVDTLARHLSRLTSNGVLTMKTGIAATLTIVFAGAVWAFGPGDGPAQKTPTGVQPPVLPAGVRPRQPSGVFTDHLGTYLTIEGMPVEGGKVATGTLLIDTVDGKKLAEPVSVLVRSPDYPRKDFTVPAKTRCVLKGYEMGEMIGTPPAVFAAAREQGRTDVNPSQVVWQWRPYFVALIVVEQKELPASK